MFIKLQKIVKNQRGEAYLAEVMVNVRHISFISENRQMRSDLVEGKILNGLSNMARFSDVSLLSPSGQQIITVIGAPDVIESKISVSTKQLLRD